MSGGWSISVSVLSVSSSLQEKHIPGLMQATSRHIDHYQVKLPQN